MISDRVTMKLTKGMEEQVNVIIWDIETIPDLQGFAAANYLTGKTDAEIREVMGEKFSEAHLPLDRLHRCSRRASRK